MEATMTSKPSSPKTRRKRCDQCRKLGDHLCEPKAQRAVDVFEKILVHTKGRWARNPFYLEEWQADEIIRPLFGNVTWSDDHQRWIRRYRVAWIELGRKNGKSELCAGIALILLVADDEEGAEIYGCAKDRDQARKVFDVAARMVELSPVLNRRLKVMKQAKRIVDERTGSYYEIVAADASGNLGHNPHGVVFDEVLTQPNDGLWNAMRTAMGTRTQPLLVAATTAGNDPTGFCAAEHAYCERVQADPSLDPARFVFLRNTPKEADWEDETNWYFANPALGSFLSIESLRDEAREAKLAPAKQNAFRQYRLNQWVQQASRWIDLGAWDASAGEVSTDGLRGRDCWAGLDLASTTDIASLCLAFPDSDGVFKLLWRYWIPEDQVRNLDERTAGAASVWVRDGWLIATPGNVIDYKNILHEIDELAQRHTIREIAYDRWGMTQMSQDLTEARMTVVPFGQGFASMSPPAKELERLVLEGKLHHGGNPVTRWMADNVVVRSDPAGNIKPDKEKSHEKIDGIVAACMALDRATRMAKTKRRTLAAGF
jgi:phage terminase large subunit-like protein